jgi:hypothetical protein
MGNDVKCWCKHCGVELPPSHTGPCPKCGKSGKRCEATAMLTIGLVLSHSAQKVHKYTMNHPKFIVISIALTTISLSAGYLFGGLVGLLVGIIVAMLNLWITPYAMKTIVEITHLGDTGKVTQETKVKSHSPEDVYNKLENIENMIEAGNRIQKFGIFYALGVAVAFLALSYYLAFLQRVGLDTTTFYSINIPGLLALGIFMLVYAMNVKKPKEVQAVGTKGRKNIKKPKQKKKK